MGNTTQKVKDCKSVKEKQGISRYRGEEKAWDIIFHGTDKYWLQIAGLYGLKGCEIDCTTSHLCDRDHVCHSYFSVIHRRWKRSLEIRRFDKPRLLIPVEKSSAMGKLLALFFNKILLVVAVSKHMVILEMTVGERGHAFPILDTKERALVAVYEPDFPVTFVEGEISPDLSKTGLLMHSPSQTYNGYFTYDLFLISNMTGELLSRTCLGKNEIQPHFAFHPSYCWSHIMVTHYNSTHTERHAILNLVDGSCPCQSSCPDIAYIVGNPQFPSFSPDGKFLFLQSFSDDRFGLTSICRTFVIDVSENKFHLIKYISCKIPGIFHSCRVWYVPVFSLCGHYLRMLNRVKSVTNVTVYRMPNVFQLKSRCRQIIMHLLSSADDVELLPLPNSLKQFLLFSPSING